MNGAKIWWVFSLRDWKKCSWDLAQHYLDDICRRTVAKKPLFQDGKIVCWRLSFHRDHPDEAARCWARPLLGPLHSLEDKTGLNFLGPPFFSIIVEVVTAYWSSFLANILFQLSICILYVHYSKTFAHYCVGKGILLACVHFLNTFGRIFKSALLSECEWKADFKVMWLC